mmetsp:Transcript_23442/g.58225  ORF Transcript_23442/g.58225 Transcript_23442/m.58225 type:complete len:214 (-) Transcript_23442:62-703(-)
MLQTSFGLATFRHGHLSEPILCVEVPVPVRSLMQVGWFPAVVGHIVPAGKHPHTLIALTMTLACNGIRIAASGCNALCWSMYLLDPTRNLLLRRGYIRQMREMPLRINLRRMFRESRDSFATLAVHRVNGHPRGKGGTRSTPSPHLVLDVRVRHPDWGYIRPCSETSGRQQRRRRRGGTLLRLQPPTRRRVHAPELLREAKRRHAVYEADRRL